MRGSSLRKKCRKMPRFVTALGKASMQGRGNLCQTIDLDPPRLHVPFHVTSVHTYSTICRECVPTIVCIVCTRRLSLIFLEFGDCLLASRFDPLQSGLVQRSVYDMQALPTPVAAAINQPPTKPTADKTVRCPT